MMIWHNIALLPFVLMHRGIGGIIGGCLFLVIYVGMLATLAMIVFQVWNYIGVAVQTGIAIVVAKRTVPAHYEWTGRRREFVEEYEILDLRINGQILMYRPTPWILERTVAHTEEPIQFVVGRFNGQIRIRKFKYL